MDSATLWSRNSKAYSINTISGQFLQCCLSEIKFSCVKQLAFEDASTFLTEAIHHFFICAKSAANNLWYLSVRLWWTCKISSGFCVPVPTYSSRLIFGWVILKRQGGRCSEHSVVCDSLYTVGWSLISSGLLRLADDIEVRRRAAGADVCTRCRRSRQWAAAQSAVVVTANITAIPSFHIPPLCSQSITTRRIRISKSGRGPLVNLFLSPLLLSLPPHSLSSNLFSPLPSYFPPHLQRGN